MTEQYLIVNIRVYLDPNEPTYIGEEHLYDLLSDFSCPNNPEETIEGLKYSVGGIMEFLECEDNDFLLNFYTRNKFKMFDVRTTKPFYDEEPHYLNQLLKFI